MARPVFLLLAYVSFAVAQAQTASSTATAAQSTMQQTSTTPSIHWLTNPSPPFHINHGPYQQQGVCDVLIDAVHRQLPGYQRLRTELPQDRISRALSDGEPMCFPCMIYRSSMRGTVLFSKPTHVYRPHQIITTSSMAGQILQRTGLPVHLPTLLRQPDLVFGYPQGRRYGVLQADIDQYGRAVTRPGFDGSMAVLEMIATGRLSYSIDYDIVKNYYNQLHKLSLTAEELQQPLPAAPHSGALVIAGRESSSGDLLFNHRPNMAMVGLPIASRLDEPVWGAIGCPNNAWGKQRIADINRHITAIRQDPAFYQTLLRWNNTAAQPDYADYWARWVDYLDPVLKEASVP